MIQLVQQRDCCGCYSCASACPVQCISMRPDEEGFRYPVIDRSNCTQCGKCVRACPVLNGTSAQNEPAAFAAYHKNEKIRMESSSGGVFTALAEDVLRQGGVVFGAAFDDRFQVEHKCCETAEELDRFRGSKYVQSRIGESYRQAKKYLENGRPVYFSGTPCQVAGLRSYLGKEYDGLICQDLICHGVPSPKVWQKYVEFRERRAKSPVRKITFRQKDEGWTRYSLSFQFTDRSEWHRGVVGDLFLRAFLRNVCLRPSCYHCAFKTRDRPGGDLTLADFWGVETVMPELFDDKGTSLVLVNSKKGEELFRAVADRLVTKPADLSQAIRFNPSYERSAAMNPKRQSFFRNLDKKDIAALLRANTRDPIFVRLKGLVKRLLKRR